MKTKLKIKIASNIVAVYCLLFTACGLLPTKALTQTVVWSDLGGATEIQPINIGYSTPSTMSLYLIMQSGSISNGRIEVVLPNTLDQEFVNTPPVHLTGITATYAGYNAGTLTFTNVSMTDGNVMHYSIAVQSKQRNVNSSTLTPVVTVNVYTGPSGTHTATGSPGTFNLTYKYAGITVLDPVVLPGYQNTPLTINFGANNGGATTNSTSQNLQFRVACLNGSVDSCELTFSTWIDAMTFENWNFAGTLLPLSQITVVKNITTSFSATTRGTYTIKLRKQDFPGGNGFKEGDNWPLTVDVTKRYGGTENVNITGQWAVAANTVLRAAFNITNTMIFSANIAGGTPAVSSLATIPSFQSNGLICHTNEAPNIYTFAYRNTGTGNMAGIINQYRTYEAPVGYMDTSGIVVRKGKYGPPLPRSIHVSTTSGNTHPVLAYRNQPTSIYVYCGAAILGAGTADTLYVSIPYHLPADFNTSVPSTAYVQSVTHWFGLNSGPNAAGYGTTWNSYWYPVYTPNVGNYFLGIAWTNPANNMVSANEVFTGQFQLNTQPFNYVGFADNTAKMSITLKMPKGLELEHNLVGDISVFYSSNTWSPSNFLMTATADSNIYTFDLLRSTYPSTSTSAYNLWVKLKNNCTAVNENRAVNITANCKVYPSTSGAPCTAGVYNFTTAGPLILHCIDEGLDFYNLEQRRQTVGLRDATPMNGMPDVPNTQAIYSERREDILIRGDTMVFTMKARVIDAGTYSRIYLVDYSDQTNAYVVPGIGSGASFTTLLLNDSPSSITAQLVNTNVSSYYNNTAYTPTHQYVWAWEIQKTDDSSFVLDDSIKIVLVHSFTTSSSGISRGNHHRFDLYATELPITAAGTLSKIEQVANPGTLRKGSSDIYNGSFTIQSISMATYTAPATVTVSATPATYNTSGGAIAYQYTNWRFPYEYRSIYSIDSVVVNAPVGYVLDNDQSFMLTAYYGTSSSRTCTINATATPETQANPIRKVFKFDTLWSTAGNLTGSTPPFVPPGGFFIFNHATHTVSASSATPRGSYTANTTVYMTRQTNYLQGELITCTSTKSYNYPLANRVLLSSTGATSKPAESNTVFYDIGLAAASSTLSSPWLYVQGNVKDAQLVISAGNGYPAATYSGTGQDNKWIQLNPCSITTNIASARLYVTYEPSACPSVEPVKFYSIANPPQTSGTWSPIDLSPSIPLTDAGFNALSANAALTDYWNAIPLNLEITNPSARIDGAITPLSQTQVNPSVLRLGATVYGNNTIQVGYQFPVELQINAIGGQTGVQYAKAEAIIPRGMEFVANSAYIEYDGIVYPITAGAMYAELLSLTGGTTAQHITLDLIDSGLPIFSKGEIAPNKTVYIRFVLNPACEVNSYYAEQISMTISGKRICGLDANNSNSHIYRSSSLFLTGVIASYAVNANLTIASNLDFASCHGSEGVRTVTFSAWRIDKATSVNMSPIDSIFVLMPAALNIDVSGEVSYAYSGYVAGSGTLSPSSMTNVLVNDGAMRKLAFKLDDTYLNSLGANVTSTTVTYSFTTQFEKALADDPVPDGTISASWMNLSQLSLECPETLAPAITKILPMQVYARPRVDNMENKTLCAEILFSGATFTGNYTGISSSYSYNWSSTGDAIGGTTSGSTVTSIPGFTTANIGAAPLTRTYTVTPTYGNCTGYDSTFTITVLPVPRSNTYTNQTYISGATTTPFAGSGTLTNITWTNSNTAIGLGLSGTGTIGTFTASNTTSVPISGTITVTPIYSFNATSCSGSPVTFTITVFPENYPQVILPCASLAVCEGMPLDLSACTPTVDVGSCTLTGSGSWTLNGSYYASPSTVSIGQNGAALAYIINTSCGSFTSNTVTVIVQELPTAADVTPSPTTYQICEGGSATLTATATAGHFVQWYSDSGLQNLIGWGNSYTVTPTTSTTYWVVAGTMGTKDFSYNGTTGDDGSPQSWTAPITGRYKLEVWGAQGGHSNDITYKGGRGGYAVGEVNLTAGDNLYVYVGGQPTASTHHWCSSGGGGGTDIRVNGNTYYHRIIVAGGGGGRHGDGLLAYYDSSCDVYAGNDGGGLSAPSFSCHGTDFIGAGQTAGGSSNYSDHVSNGEFGYGPDNTGNNIASTGGWNGGGAGADEWASGGAGGGWYGGGTSWPIGGGGSGWIYTASAFGVWQSGDPVNAALWQLSPTCYLEDAQTIAGDQPFTWPDGTVQTGHSGHGYARITFMEAECPAPPLAAHTVTVTVLPIVTPAATITASDNNVCMGTSVTYTVSNTVNQGTAPSYQWLKGGSPIGGAIGTTYSYEPENGDIISCEMTSNDPCAGTTTVTSNAITMTMTPIVIPSVSVSAVPD